MKKSIIISGLLGLIIIGYGAYTISGLSKQSTNDTSPENITAANTTATSTPAAPLKFDPQSTLVGFLENFMVVDTGTGPSLRSYTVVDSLTNEVVYELSAAADLTLVEPHSISYWIPTEQSVTAEACPDVDIASATELGFTVQIQEAVIYNLRTKEAVTDGTRCQTIQ